MQRLRDVGPPANAVWSRRVGLFAAMAFLVLLGGAVWWAIRVIWRTSVA